MGVPCACNLAENQVQLLFWMPESYGRASFRVGSYDEKMGHATFLSFDFQSNLCFIGGVFK